MFSGFRELIDSFTTDPSNTLITLAYIAICILFSLILHECAHGWVAYKCGDPTAKMLGRLTLNPAKHLDPIGTICMVFLRVGWAKPVPINPRRFKHFRRDYILVSIAGIVTNLLLCIICMVIIALLNKVIFQPDILQMMRRNDLSQLLVDIYKVPINSFIPLPYANAIYNGSFEYVERFVNENAVWLLYIQRLFLMLAQMNLGLAIFNLIPIPPLDGYRFLDMFVFKGKLALDRNMMYIIQIGFLVLCMSGLLSNALSTVNGAVFGFLSNIVAVII